MTTTERLEGLLPETGPATKDDRIIAEAVAELRATQGRLGDAINIEWELRSALEWTERRLDRMVDNKPGKVLAIGMALGALVAVLVGWVW